MLWRNPENYASRSPGPAGACPRRGCRPTLNACEKRPAKPSPHRAATAPTGISGAGDQTSSAVLSSYACGGSRYTVSQRGPRSARSSLR